MKSFVLFIVMLFSYSLYEVNAHTQEMDNQELKFLRIVETAEKELSTELNLTDTDVSISACGGTWTTAHISSTKYPGNILKLSIAINSTGHCGSQAPYLFEKYFVYGSQFRDEVIYHENELGCEGKNWDMLGEVRLNGGFCSTGGICSYFIKVIAAHGGAGSQCHDYQSKEALYQVLQTKNLEVK